MIRSVVGSRGPVLLVSSLALVACAPLVVGCAGSSTGNRQTTPVAKPERLEMEPLRIEVQGSGAERKVEAFDAGTLFEQAGAELAAEHWDAAVAAYDRMEKIFPDSRYAVAGLYNAGLAYEGKKDYASAVARYRWLVEHYGKTRDALDALFRMGACLAELGNWAGSADAFAQVLEHLGPPPPPTATPSASDISIADRIEATARRGLAQYNMKDVATAERTFREVQTLYRDYQAVERLEDDFFVALARYYLAEMAHQSFRELPVRWPQRQLHKDLEAKAQQLLVAQARYVDVARIRNPAWATAAGYQMAMLYREFYDALMEAPVPPEMTAEMKQIYLDELKKEIEPLLRKAIHAHELTLGVAQRNGIDNEWVQKSTAELAHLQALLTPATGTPPTPSPTPTLDPIAPPTVPQPGNDVRPRTLF